MLHMRIKSCFSTDDGDVNEQNYQVAMSNQLYMVSTKSATGCDSVRRGATVCESVQPSTTGCDRLRRGSVERGRHDGARQCVKVCDKVRMSVTECD